MRWYDRPMRHLVLFVTLLAACKDESVFTDAGSPGDGAALDAKVELDAEPFVCDAQACGADDACCPAACNANNDADCAAVCDNGVLETGEQCDPLASCPSSCAAVGCQLRDVTGAACGAACADGATITACADGDDCCPDACNATNDAECAAVCGNTVIESGEHCDPLASCPTACPAVGCTLRTLYDAGTCQAQCVATGAISGCANDDACCPAGCNANNDNDCDPFCGNSVVETGEVCDGNCPTCGTELFSCFGETGSATTCDLRCHQPYVDCENADACCPYKPGGGAADCNRSDDTECAGNNWRYVYFGLVSFAPCTTVRVYGMQRYDSALFTTCSPTGGAESTGDTTITAIYQDDGINYFPSTSLINDDTTDPYALPLLAGWDCRNSAGAQYMSTAPQNTGGLILRGTPQPVRVTICGYNNSSGRVPFYIWINGAGNPNPG